MGKRVHLREDDLEKVSSPAPKPAVERVRPVRSEGQPLYQASPIKRLRSTKAEVEQRRAALLEIVAAQKPMTVRQVFYQATVARHRREDRGRLH